MNASSMSTWSALAAVKNFTALAAKPQKVALKTPPVAVEAVKKVVVGRGLFN